MKKPYQKPEVVVENFVLANNIASGCTAGTGGSADHSNGSDCIYSDATLPGEYSFFEDNNRCTAWVSEDGMDDICYNTPNGSIVIFS